MCTVEAYRKICVFGAKRGKRLGEASPFLPFLSLIHILPICFDSAQVLYIYFSKFHDYVDLIHPMEPIQLNLKLRTPQIQLGYFIH